MRTRTGIAPAVVLCLVLDPLLLARDAVAGDTAACSQTCPSGLRADELLYAIGWDCTKRYFGVAQQTPIPQGFENVASYHLLPAIQKWDQLEEIAVGQGFDIQIIYVTDKVAQGWTNPDTDPAYEDPFIVTDGEKAWKMSSTIRINLFQYGPELWNEETPECLETARDLQSVLMHELGHSLQLKNRADPCTIMYPFHDLGFCPREVKAIDAAAIKCRYACSEDQRLAVLSGAESCDCDSGNPDAAVSGFKCIDGIASWYTLFEDGTVEYVIESSESMSGPWEAVAIERSGIGEHGVAVRSTGAFVRLVEVDTAGHRAVRGLDRAWTTNAVNAARAKALASQGRSAVGHSTLPVANTPSTGCTSWAPVPQYVIFTTDPLFSTVDCTIGAHRQAQGYGVRIINVSQVPPNYIADLIRDRIAEYYQDYGTRYFHLVGTWEDDLTSSMWQADAYWRAKREAFLEARKRGQGPNIIGGSITPFLIPADAMAPTAASPPYGYSDQPYADVDGDGIPDVVVTRWPFTAENKVSAAYLKTLEHGYFPKPQRALFLGSDFDSYGYEAELVRAAMAELIGTLHATAIEQQSSELYLSDYSIENWNSELASRFNSFLPDAIFILGHTSNSYRPGGFFSKSLAVPWQMSMLNPFVYARLVVAASCDGADYEDYTQYGAPSCVDFVGEPYLGTIQWIGPTGASIQAANALVSIRLVEELYGNPYRPMAESWLIGMQRAYQDVGASELYDELLPTLASYTFLGDPLTPFANLPSIEISSRARYSGGGEDSMPATFAIGCPQGDADAIIVEVALDASGVVSALPIDALTLSPPHGSAVYFFGATSIAADSAATLIVPSNKYRTTFTVSSFSGCGIDSALVSLYGIPLGYAHLNVKSPDVELGGVTHGKVDLLDFGTFGASYTSPPKNYNSCVDYEPAIGLINAGDFATFGAHWEHAAPGGGSAPADAPSVVPGTVVLDFEESHPLVGGHTLRATVGLEGVPAFKAAMFALRNENPKLEFTGWMESAVYDGETMSTETVRDGHREVFIGVLDDDGANSDVTLGTAEFRVASDQALALTEDDLALVTADLLSHTDQRSTLAVSSLNVRRSVASVTYRNELAQNYPNPFNPTTTISFSLAQAADARLSIYDVRGALVKSLLNRRKERGIHRIQWDGTSNQGQSVASGVYFYKFVAGSFVDMKKMVVLK